MFSLMELMNGICHVLNMLVHADWQEQTTSVAGFELFLQNQVLVELNALRACHPVCRVYDMDCDMKPDSH